MNRFTKQKEFVVKKITLLLVAVLCTAGALWAQGKSEDQIADFPKQPITLTVPYGAGGNADVLARAVAEHATEVIGQPIGVVNRTGAGGVVAVTEFIDKNPDGYNLITANIGLMAIRPQTTTVAYEYDDFVPIIGNIGKTALVICSSSKSDIKDFASLAAYGQDNIVKYGTFGLKSDSHILQAALFSDMGVEATPVPFDQVTEPIASLMGGNIDLVCALAPVVAPYVESGELVPILTFNDSMEVQFENTEAIPSAKALGYDIDYSGFNFYAVPKGTPEAIVKFYQEKFAEIYETQEIKDLQARMGFVVDPLTPEEIDEKITKGIENVKQWIKYVE
jgi:tripartite-type tricarboxylate transporter receptor subunit TctC